MKKQSGGPLPQSILRAAERYAIEAHSDLQQFDSRFLEQFADAGDWQSQLQLLEAYCIGRFDLIAEWMLFTSVSPDIAAINPLYEKYLDRAIEEQALPYLSVALKPLRSDLRDEFVSRTELKLSARKLWWLAESRTRRVLSYQASNESPNSPRNTDSRKHESPIRDLPRKTSDLSEMFIQAKLAPRQAEIASLAWERGMKKAAIARHLGLNWKTVDESLESAKRRVDKATVINKLAARTARRDPEKHGR